MSVVPGGVSVVLEPWITRMPHINSTLVTSWVTAAAGNQRAAATQWFTGSVSCLAAQGRQAGRQAGWAQTGCAASRGCWRPQRHPHKHPVATSRLRSRKLHYARPGWLSLANTWDFYENSVSSDEDFDTKQHKTKLHIFRLASVQFCGRHRTHNAAR